MCSGASSARRYAAYPDERLFLELLNEPAVDAKTWNAHAARLIRTVAPGVAGPDADLWPCQFSATSRPCSSLRPFADANIVYAVHFYDPMIFTHQGLDWSDDPLRHLHGVPFPGEPGRQPHYATAQRCHQSGGRKARQESADRSRGRKQRIEGDIARAAAWSEQHRRAVIINEFGVLGWKAPSADRLRWLSSGRAPPRSVIASAGPIGTMPTASASCVASAIGKFLTRRSSMRSWEEHQLDSARRRFIRP